MKNRALYDARNDMQDAVRQAQDYFRQAAEETGDKANALINQGMAKLDELTDHAQKIKVKAVRKSRQAAQCTDDYVSENTWRAMVIAAGAGLLLGWVVASD